MPGPGGVPVCPYWLVHFSSAAFLIPLPLLELGKSSRGDSMHAETKKQAYNQGNGCNGSKNVKEAQLQPETERFKRCGQADQRRRRA